MRAKNAPWGIKSLLFTPVCNSGVPRAAFVWPHLQTSPDLHLFPVLPDRQGTFPGRQKAPSPPQAVQGWMCHFSLSLCTASEPKLPSTHPIKRSTLLYLFVSAARDILVSSTEAVQVTRADVLFLDIGFHYIKPAHWEICWEGGDRKEGEGGKGGSLFTREGKRKPQRSKINDSWFTGRQETQLIP